MIGDTIDAIIALAWVLTRIVRRFHPGEGLHVSFRGKADACVGGDGASVPARDPCTTAKKCG